MQSYYTTYTSSVVVVILVRLMLIYSLAYSVCVCVCIYVIEEVEKIYVNRLILDYFTVGL